MFRKRITVLLACLLLFAMAAGCAGGQNPQGGTGNDPAATASPAQPSAEPTPTPTPAPDTFTLNEAISAMPLNWNIHTWETEADEYVWRYTEMPFMDAGFTRDEDGNTQFVWIPEMALSVEDVTASWSGCADWGISHDETGRVWRIRLNPDACWADEASTPIEAGDYLYSMQQLLSPDMQNYRAAAYYEGASAIMGAYGYAHSGSTSWVENVDAAGTTAYAFADWVRHTDGQYYSVDGSALYFMLQVPISYWLQGYSLEEYYQMGIVYEECYTGLAALANEEGYVPVTDDTIELLYTFIGSGDWGYDSRDDLAYYTAYQKVFPQVEWETVGLLQEDAHTLIYLCEQEISPFHFYASLTSNWLVYEPLYEAGKITGADGRVYTSYGSSTATYMGYGPYRLTAMEPGKSLVFSRNDSWYGYRDGKHEGQYQTTGIVAELLTGHDDALARFQRGELDTVRLEDGDMAQYRDAPNLLRAEEDYTYRLFMVTDRDALAALQEAASSDTEKINKLCLSYDAFRQALSFAIDRADFVQKGTTGYAAATGLLNDLYYYDIAHDTNSVYRETPQAMAGICAAYGMTYGEEGPYATLEEAYSACTGYDPTLARQLFQQAYDEMCAAGDWSDDMVISLNCAVSATALTEQLITQNQLLQGYLDAATEGTGFAGKLSLTYITSGDRYDAVEKGEIEMGVGAWGGAYFFPFNMMQCYCDPDYIQIPEACGFDPTTETLTISLNGTDVTKTYQDWSRSIVTGGEYAAADMEVKLQLLAAIESGLIQQRHFIVLCSKASLTLYADQIRFATTDYNLLYQFGGIRGLTYAYSDAAWAAMTTGRS